MTLLWKTINKKTKKERIEKMREKETKKKVNQ